MALTTTPLTRDDIEIATRAAEHFTRLYYAAYDADTRLAELPGFYRTDSSLAWNGHAFQGVDRLKELIEKMPPTHHDMHSFDCHPIPGSSPPSLLITVSGDVTHGPGPTAPPSGPVKSTDGVRRVFSQTFMLVPDPTAGPGKVGEVAKYYISADAFRFVG